MSTLSAPPTARHALGRHARATTGPPPAGRAPARPTDTVASRPALPSPGRPHPRPPAALAAPDSATATATATTPAAPPSFAWRSAWYPVALASSLDTGAPAQVLILGTEVVLWHAPPSEGEGGGGPAAWNAALDACPHRLAALSSGRLEGGILSCRYHGWAFSGDGACVANPQAADARAEATVCASSRAHLATLPCRVAQGLVWVWPTPGRSAAAQADATPLPLYPEADGSDAVTYPGSSGEWGFQVAPVDYVLMTENSLDPSHAPFLHEKVMGSNTRAGAAPCVMKLDAPGLGPGGFTISHGGYTKKQIAEGMVGTREFTAPGRLRAEYTFDDGRQAIAVIYFTPTKPGYTSTFGKFYQKPAPGGGGGETAGWAGHGGGARPSLAARARAWAFGVLASSALFHALTHGLVDQDNNILHPIFARLQASPQGWRSGYWLATPADAGVGAFHRFLGEWAGGGPDWDPRAPPAPALTRDALFDHYDRHTKHCPTCLAALGRLDRVVRALKVLVYAAGLVAAAAAVVAFAATPGSVSGGRLAAAGGGGVVVGSVAAAARGAVLGLREKFFRADKLADE